MIRFYKIPLSFDTRLLSSKSYIERFRVSKDGSVLEVIADGALLDIDPDMTIIPKETTLSKTQVDKFNSYVNY